MFMIQKRKIYFITLGCKVNSKESDGLRQLFLQNNYIDAASVEDADVIYVNSCTVTADGAAKSRAAVRRARRTSPTAVIVMGGCLPQTSPELYDADIVVGNTDRASIINLLENYYVISDKTVAVTPHRDNEKFEPLPTGGDGHTRAFLKIQDGCPRSCSYCIVSRARGAPRSADEKDLLEGAKLLVRQGHREIVLCGINLSYYGCDTKTDLAELCQKLENVEGLYRIRLGSLEPDMLTDELCEGLSLCKKLAPHFHLSLQSGSNKVLKAMNRYYNRSEYIDIINRLRKYFDKPTFTTDIMVGFPGESDKDFSDSCNLVNEVGFLKVHVFRYSPRPQTVAADMDNQIPEEVKKKRSALLSQIAFDVGEQVKIELNGVKDSFIVESKQKNGEWVGTTGRYLRATTSISGIKKGDLINT